MARKKNRSVEVFSLSFLDCICCGFGAVILIFVITTGRGLKLNEGRLAAASIEIKSLEAQIEEQRAGLEQDQLQWSRQNEASAQAEQQKQRALELMRDMDEKREELARSQADLHQVLASHQERESSTPAPPSGSST